MAVFTPVSHAQLQAWLAALPVGDLLHFEGIAAGIENSNFFVTTAQGAWVLTLFERLEPAQLPFYLQLMQHLAARGIPCPNPVPQANGQLFASLAHRPASLVTRLAGTSVTQPTAAECAQVGRLLAHMHLAAADFALVQPNLRGLSWWTATAPRLLPRMATAQKALLTDEIAQQALWCEHDASLPTGAVHADLFRDNVLFENGRLSGVIDFYFAGTDTWLFDLAVTCNDWCTHDADGTLDYVRLHALLHAYDAQRTLNAAEHAAWPAMLRAAALRFWVSRLDDWHSPRPAEQLTPKDPGHFERILLARRTHVPPLNHSLSDVPCKSFAPPPV